MKVWVEITKTAKVLVEVPDGANETKIKEVVDHELNSHIKERVADLVGFPSTENFGFIEARFGFPATDDNYSVGKVTPAEEELPYTEIKI